MAIGYAAAGGYATAEQAKQPRESTFNDRLNMVASSLHYQCERIEGVLSRVNGTPQTKNEKSADVAQIRPTHSLAQIVELLEAVNQRLADLSTGVERIA